MHHRLYYIESSHTAVYRARKWMNTLADLRKVKLEITLLLNAICLYLEPGIPLLGVRFASSDLS